VLSQLSDTPIRKIDYNTKKFICKEKITKNFKKMGTDCICP